MPRALRFKRFDVPNFCSGSTTIVYVFFDDRRCVFTGFDPEGTGTSSINNAESIIETIARVERVDPRRIRFFDLQTHSMYGRMRGKSSGEFEFDELVLAAGPRVQVKDWIPTQCPEDIRTLFANFIGLNPYQQKHGLDRSPEGIKSLLRSINADGAI